MDEINYLRTLAGLPLLESHYDPQTDEEIDLALQQAGFQKDEIEIAYDALDILRDAGRAGIDGKSWTAKVRELRPELQSGFMSKMTNALKGTRIDRGGAGFVWIVEGTAEVAPDMRDSNFDPRMRDAMSSHIEATNAMIRRAKQLTANGQPIILTNLARTIHSQAGIPLDHAMPIVMQIIANNPKMFVSNRDGTYSFNDPAEKSPPAMTTFRNILNNPGTLGDE